METTDRDIPAPGHMRVMSVTTIAPPIAPVLPPPDVGAAAPAPPATPEVPAPSAEQPAVAAAKPALAKPRVPGYTWGQRLDFGRDGSAVPYLTSGWSANPASHWTVADDTLASVLVFSPQGNGGAKKLELEADPFLGGNVKRQEVQVFVNGSNVGKLEFRRHAVQTLVIPEDKLPSGDATVTLEFRIPTATSPASLGESDDKRKLGISVKSLRMGDA